MATRAIPTSEHSGDSNSGLIIALKIEKLKPLLVYTESGFLF
jgi:hypothetical protein